MKKIVLVCIALVITIPFIYCQKTVNIVLNSEKSKFEVINLSKTGFTTVGSFTEMKLVPKSFKEGNFMGIEVNGLVKIFDEGMPNIPVISKLIEIPQGADVEFIIKSYDEEIIQLSDYGITDKIQPALRSQSKSEDEVPFVVNEEVYLKDDFINKDIAGYEESGQMRDIRLGRIEIRPIQYNPVKNTLRILNNLVIEVKFNNADFAATEELKRKYGSPYINNVLEGQVINFDRDANKELITQVPTHLVIVSHRMFEAQLAPFIAWKVKKGFKVTVAYTDVIGSTTSAIKTYLQGIYEGSDPMTFVLLVGDVAQIPAWAGSSGSHPTDLRYFEYTGDDIPEVYYGRFSAQNTSQLQPQIDKSLEYEQFLMPDPAYLEEVVMIAGDDASYEMTYGNGQINYGTTYYFNATNDIFSNTYLQPLDNGAASLQIKQNISDGVSFGNYTAHCSSSGWATPSFSTSDIPALQNANKYGLLVGNCCLSSKFDDSECFGEAILRVANKGAIGYIGGSNSTYWDEDYWWGCGFGTAVQFPVYENFGTGAYDGWFHNMPNEINNLNKWYTTQDQMVKCGQLAVESSTSGMKEYYWEIYCLMGDPTLLNYIGIPETMTVTPNPLALMLGMTSLNVASAPYSYVALSQNGILIAAALSNSSGEAILNFAAENLSVGTADLVVTRQNTIPYIGTITVSPADQPYIVLNSYTTNISPDYGQTINLNVTLENVAASGSGYDAANVVATLSLTDPYVTITDGTENYGTIVAGTTSTIDAAFQITLANIVPDQYNLNFNLSMTGNDAKYTWPGVLSMTANAPEFIIGDMTLSGDDNGNGRLDPGENAVLSFVTNNTGHAGAADISTLITGDSPYLNVLNNNQTVSIDGQGSLSVAFNIQSTTNAPDGSLVNLTYDVAQDVYTASATGEMVIGQSPQVIVGNGTQAPSSYYPFDNYWENGKSQILYLGSELGTGIVNIQEIAYNFSNIGSISSFNNMKINFLQTGLTALPSGSYASMTGSTEVFNAASFTMPASTGWFNFDITDFSFDAAQNLIVEIIWGDNGAWDSNKYTVNCTNTAFNSVTYGYSDTQTPPAFGGSSLVRPNATFFMEGEPAGDQYTVTFTVIDEASSPVNNAVVTVGTLGQSVDLSGQTSFNLVADDYLYSASAPGYTPISNIPFTVSVNVEIPIVMYPSDINDISNIVSIYPNPSNGLFTVDFNSFNFKKALIAIIDINGRTVFERQASTNRETIDLPYLNSGFYFVKISMDGKYFNSKIIIK